MTKALTDMTLEELWQLFPIDLVDHDPRWREWAKEEIASLALILKDFHPVFHHVGSTAIENLKAKPIIDILVELPATPDWPRLQACLETAGYICMSASSCCMSFNKGYTPEGYAERVFHIHCRREGDNDEICFRDYLRRHPDVAKQYEALKLSLLPRYRHDRDAYTAAKSPFIRSIMSLANPTPSPKTN